MKKAMLLLILAAALCLLGSALAEEGTATVMVYLCGTDLQEDACQDLLEMAEVEAGDAINLVVLAGGMSGWRTGAGGPWGIRTPWRRS